MNEIKSGQKRNMIFAVMMTGTIISSMLQTSLTTALPSMMADFSVSAATAQWLTSAYSLAMGIMIPVTPFLLRRFPTKRLFLAGMSIFAAGLFVGVTASHFWVLLLGRIIQALGNGLLMSMTQVVTLTIFPIEKRGTAMGIYGLAAGAAPVIAPTITGIVIDYFSWRAVFWFGFILAVLDIVLAAFVMQNVLDTEKQSFDFVSLVLSAVGFSGILLGLGNLGSDQFFSVNIGLPLLIGIIVLFLFVRRQLKMEEPFLEIRTFRNREFTLAVIVSMLLYAVMIAGSTLFPIYIQTVHHMSAAASGLVMMPGSFVMAFISPFTGKIYDRFGIRKLAVAGSAAMLVSCVGISFVGETTSVPYLVIMYIIRLIAIGCIMMPIVTWGMSTMESRYTSHGTALLTSLRTISGSIGSALFVAVMAAVTNRTAPGATANAAGVDAAFIGISAAALLQLVLVFFVVGKKETTQMKAGIC